MECPNGKPYVTFENDVPTGFFSRIYRFDESKPRVPQSLKALYDGACRCDDAVTASCCADTSCLLNSSYESVRLKGEYRQWYCANLYDVAGNLITGNRLPQACGGPGPDILQPYNPIIGAIDNVQGEAGGLLDEYTDSTQTRVKNILKAGFAIILIVVVIALMMMYL